jgi:hypothetical protein
MTRALPLFALLAAALFAASPAHAQLAGTDTTPGSSCAGFPAGATRMTADPDQDGAQVILVCNGTTWNAMANGSSSWGMNTVPTSQTTASSAYTDLATTGPSVTIATDATALVTLTAQLSNSDASRKCKMGFAVSDATTMAASDTYALQATSAGADGVYQASGTFYVTGLTAGTNTFTAEYASGANTCTFAERQMIVMATGSIATCADTTPDAFSFADVANQDTLHEAMSCGWKGQLTSLGALCRSTTRRDPSSIS